jgi:hypothetical protein
MKRVSLLALALFAVVALALAQGCKSGPAVDVTGKWSEVNGPDAVEFKSDGTFTGNFIYDSTGSEKSVDGKYSTSGDRLTLTSTNDPPASMVWKVASSAAGILDVTYQKGGAYKLDGSTAKFHHSN